MLTLLAVWEFVKSKLLWLVIPLVTLAGTALYAYRRGVQTHAEDIYELTKARDAAEAGSKATTEVLKVVKETHNEIAALPPAVPADDSVRTPAQQQGSAKNEPVAIADADSRSAAGRLASIVKANEK